MALLFEMLPGKDELCAQELPDPKAGGKRHFCSKDGPVPECEHGEKGKPESHSCVCLYDSPEKKTLIKVGDKEKNKYC